MGNAENPPNNKHYSINNTTDQKAVAYAAAPVAVPFCRVPAATTTRGPSCRVIQVQGHVPGLGVVSGSCNNRKKRMLSVNYKTRHLVRTPKSSAAVLVVVTWGGGARCAL